jgi:hypothetical protein
LHHEGHGSQAELVAGTETVFFHALAVDECSVFAVEVADRQFVLVDVDFAMLAGDDGKGNR